MKVGVAYAYRGKEVLARAMNKYFQFSNNVMLLKTVAPLSSED